jgi:tungstate transport system permease protein
MDAVHEVLGRSALVSLTATAIALALGVPAGTWLALAHRRGRRMLATVVNTGMAIPTVVVGLVVALLLWRSGPLGEFGLIYTLRGMIIAQVLIAAPLIAGITMAGLQALPPELVDQLRALGANTPQLVWRLWIEARCGSRRACRCSPRRWQASDTRSQRSDRRRSSAATSTARRR